MESARDRKIREAVEFFSRIKVGNSSFIGISGSVSYEPKEEDDIDIFLIAKNNRLWISILEVLIFRRIYKFNDLCLSLCMDEAYATSYFADLKESIAVKDSIHVVPISGERYFKSLIMRSSIISRKLNEEGRVNVAKDTQKDPPFNPLEFLAFVFVAAWINIRAIITSKSNPQSGEGSFNTIFSLHTCYFNTEKYRILNDNYMRTEATPE